MENIFSIPEECTCGRKHSVITGVCVLKENVHTDMLRWLQENNYKKVAVFCDENTEKYTKNFESAADICVLKGNVHATETYAAEAIEYTKNHNAEILIACGSGSIHDITRYAAHELKLPFVSYPTAASVDGFMSGIAAMTWYGQKHSFPSTPPTAVFADHAVCADAPERLTASGVGDVLGKYVSLFDWETAHILTGEYICDTIKQLTNDAVTEVRKAIANRANLSKLDYTRNVLYALLISGLAIQLTGNSRPCSASEHHMSHLWEMELINEEADGLHGEQVAIGTLLVMDKYDKAMKKGLDYEKIKNINLEKVFSHEYLEPVYGKITDGILKENMPKGTYESSSLHGIRIDDVAKIDEAIHAAWAKIPSMDELRGLMQKADCVSRLSEIGLPDEEEFIEKTLQYAPYVRDRLTLLKVINACERN
ncbi:MAG: sn-glycerol-1-phosphate dehydrogenase [Ruminococcaceae bacterium]|nr:sn-glycerol-1-phosphate dehydrogenase [Oscillospiraceae bacterium]